MDNTPIPTPVPVPAPVPLPHRPLARKVRRPMKSPSVRRTLKYISLKIPRYRNAIEGYKLLSSFAVMEFAFVALLQLAEIHEDKESTLHQMFCQDDSPLGYIFKTFEFGAVVLFAVSLAYLCCIIAKALNIPSEEFRKECATALEKIFDSNDKPSADGIAKLVGAASVVTLGAAVSIGLAVSPRGKDVPLNITPSVSKIKDLTLNIKPKILSYDGESVQVNLKPTQGAQTVEVTLETKSATLLNSFISAATQTSNCKLADGKTPCQELKVDLSDLKPLVQTIQENSSAVSKATKTIADDQHNTQENLNRLMRLTLQHWNHFASADSANVKAQGMAMATAGWDDEMGKYCNRRVNPPPPDRMANAPSDDLLPPTFGNPRGVDTVRWFGQACEFVDQTAPALPPGTRPIMAVRQN